MEVAAGADRGLLLATAATTALLLLSTPALALASFLRVGRKASGWAYVERAAFSGLGWTLWSLALVAVARGLAHSSPSLAAASTSWLDALGADPARELALTGAAAAATGGALFMTAGAIAAATGRGGGGGPGAGAPPPPPPPGVARPPPVPRRRRRRLFTPGTSASLITALGAAWAAAGCAFVLAAPSLTGPAARGVYLAAAGACLLAGAGTTHGFGGRLRARALAGPAAAWRFVQPGRGGPAFCAAQAGAWGLTGCAGAGLLALARLAVAAAPGGRALAAGAAATAAALALGQLLIGASLLVWRADKQQQQQHKGGDDGDCGAVATKNRRGRVAWGAPAVFWWAPLVILYAPIHALLAAVGLSFLLSPLSPSLTAAAWAVGTVLAYALTARGDPAATGCREWPAFQAWLEGGAFEALARVGCPVRVVHDDGGGGGGGQGAPPPAETGAAPSSGGGPSPERAGGGQGGGTAPPGHPVFAVAPHGLYPISTILLSLHPALRALTGGARIAVLAANAVLAAPVIRDFAAWAGVRAVSRETAAATLAARPVLLMPGGQKELVHTWRLLGDRRELVLVRRTGFVRLAVAAGSPLVPVLVLGEAEAHTELFHAPALKSAAVARLGFPFPYFPMGRWGGPLPKPGPLTFVVGRPVWPQAVRAATEDGGMDAVVAATHARYFAELGGLVARHAPGVTLVWQDD